jgi:acyl carrier protein
MTDVRQGIVDIIKKVVKSASPVGQDADKSLLAGDLDSLDFASVLMAIEDEFDVSLQDVEIEDINTINKLADHVVRAKKTN